MSSGNKEASLILNDMAATIANNMRLAFTHDGYMSAT
jgi:hypothetical protein